MILCLRCMLLNIHDPYIISEAQNRGELTKKQAYDLRQAVHDANKERAEFVVKSDAIEELDKKVTEAVRFYR